MKSQKWWVGVLLAGVVIVGFSFPASAQQGFYIGTGVGIVSPSQSGDVLDEIGPQTGFALELLHLGYNFTDNFGIGLQWGAAAGYTDWADKYDDGLVWSQGYFCLSSRLSMALGQNWGYLELGVGNYSYLMQADDYDITSDPTIGYRLALGYTMAMNNLYLTAELSYHFVEYTDEAEFKNSTRFYFDFHERGDMLLLLIKVGYHVKSVKE